MITCNIFDDICAEALFHFLNDNDVIYHEYCLAAVDDISIAEFVYGHYLDKFHEYALFEFGLNVEFL